MHDEPIATVACSASYDLDTSDLSHRWYAFLGMSDVAVKHIMEVLACGHQSKATQELFLRDFFEIVQVIIFLFRKVGNK